MWQDWSPWRERPGEVSGEGAVIVAVEGPELKGS